MINNTIIFCNGIFTQIKLKRVKTHTMVNIVNDSNIDNVLSY